MLQEFVQDREPRLDAQLPETILRRDKEFDQRRAQNGRPQMYWKAGHGWMRLSGVKKWDFVKVEGGRSKKGKKVLFFRRINGKGKQVGRDLPIHIHLEEGRWFVYIATH